MKIEDSAKRQTLKPTLATVLAVIWLSGCTTDDPPPVGTVAGPTTSIEASAGAVDQESLLPAVRAFTNAVAAKDADALVQSFASNGVVIDADRRIEGADAIRRWATNETVTGTLTLLHIVESSGNRQRLLVSFAPGGSGGFEAYYTFDVAGDRITQLDLQYA